MTAEGLRQTGHPPGGAVIQDINLQGLVINVFDGQQRGLDDFVRFTATGYKDVYRPVPAGPGPLGLMTPQMPNIIGHQGQQQKGKELCAQKEKIRDFPVSENQEAEPKKIGNARNQGHQGKGCGSETAGAVLAVKIPSFRQAPGQISQKQKNGVPAHVRPLG
jgi:hypothetical protein